MIKRIAKKATALILTVLMLFSMASPAFAIESVEDLPINMEDSSSNSSSASESEDTTSDLISSDTDSENTSSDTSSNETAEDEEFKVLPFPWQNTMVDADGNEIDSSRAAQAVIECSWMKYKNPAMADKGEIPWLLVTIGGKVAYCVDTFNHNTNGGTSFVEKTDYAKLSTGQKQTISYIMRYGAKTIAQDTDNILLHMATQTLIWEVVDGDRAPYTLAGSGGGVYQDLVKRYPNIASKYNSIIGEVKVWGMIPSFAERFEGNAPTYKLEGDGPYTAALENTNQCDLYGFSFQAEGIDFGVSGRTLNVSSAKEITSPITVKTEKMGVTAGDSFIFWFDPSGKDQTRTSPGIDPVPAYFKLSIKTQKLLHPQSLSRTSI